MGIGVNLWINLRSIATLTILNLPVHEHGMSFYLFRFSLISFSHVLQFSLYKPCLFFQSSFFLLIVPAPDVEAYLSPIELPWNLCRNPTNRRLYSLLLRTSVLMPIPHSFDYCGVTVSLEIKYCKSSTLFFLIIVQGLLDPLHFNVHFRISL